MQWAVVNGSGDRNMEEKTLNLSMGEETMQPQGIWSVFQCSKFCRMDDLVCTGCKYNQLLPQGGKFG